MRKKLLKIFILLVILIFLIYFVIVFRRFIIINKIRNAYNEYSKNTNYYINITHMTDEEDESDNNESDMELYVKGNNYKEILYDKNSSDKQIYFVYLDNNIAYKFDENTLYNQLISLEDAPKKYQFTELINLSLISDSIKENILNALDIFNFHISSNQGNYVIKSNGVEEYINKDTCLLNKKVYTDDLNKTKVINYVIEFDIVTDSILNEI